MINQSAEIARLRAELKRLKETRSSSMATSYTTRGVVKSASMTPASQVGTKNTVPRWG